MARANFPRSFSPHCVSCVYTVIALLAAAHPMHNASSEKKKQLSNNKSFVLFSILFCFSLISFLL